MEKEVKYILDKNNIEYEEQKKFPWLKNKNLLSLDFYLPKYKLYIECQGRQHFMPVECYGGKEGFELTQQRDFLKKQQCEENGLKPIYYCIIKRLNEFLGEKIVKNEEELIRKIIQYGEKN